MLLIGTKELCSYRAIFSQIPIEERWRPIIDVSNWLEFQRCIKHISNLIIVYMIYKLRHTHIKITHCESLSNIFMQCVYQHALHKSNHTPSTPYCHQSKHHAPIMQYVIPCVFCNALCK